MSSDKIKAYFVKDYALPIHILEEPYFSYFLELYEPLFECKSKYKMLLQAIENYGSEKNFIQKYHQIQEDIIKNIKETSAFEKYINLELDQYPYLGSQWHKKARVYRTENHNKQFISLDLIKANYFVMQFVDPNLVLNTKTYSELIGTFSDEPYFQNSKYFRQVIFGNLSPKRQQHIQKHIMGQIDQKIIEKCEIEADWIDCSTADELTIQIPSKIDSNTLVEQINSTIKSDLKQFQHMIRIENYSLKQIKESNFYIKHHKNGQIQFKNVPKVYFAQCYKYYTRQPIEDWDLVFQYENHLAKFLNPVF